MSNKKDDARRALEAEAKRRAQIEVEGEELDGRAEGEPEKAKKPEKFPLEGQPVSRKLPKPPPLPGPDKYLDPKVMKKELDETSEKWEGFNGRITDNKRAQGVKDILTNYYLMIQGHARALERKKGFGKNEIANYKQALKHFTDAFEQAEKQFPEFPQKKLGKGDTIEQLVQSGNLRAIKKEEPAHLPDAPGGPRSPRSRGQH